MGEFLSYSIISGLLMLAMYLAYSIFLARENQHSYNRGVLLAIYAVSFLAIPLKSLFGNLSRSGSGTFAADGVEVVGVTIAPGSNHVWGTILIWIFLAGIAVMAIKTVVIWVRLSAVIRSGDKILHEGFTLVVTDDDAYAPFSWMRYVVISRRDYEENCAAIATHELKHVACFHWIDLLIAQGVCIVNWFNPAAWLMRDELMLVHEYQADMAVIESGHSPKEYQTLLIKKAVGARFPSLANSLNHSKLKKRITMMYKEKSGAGRKFKALALVPMFALALGVASVPAVRAAVSTISNSDVTVSKGSDNQPQDKTAVRNFKFKNLNNDGNKTTITIIGDGCGNCLTVSGGTFTTNGKTYHANSLLCNMTGGVATITATFPFTSEYENSSMTLVVNGEEVRIDLEEAFGKSTDIVI